MLKPKYFEENRKKLFFIIIKFEKNIVTCATFSLSKMINFSINDIKTLLKFMKKVLLAFVVILFSTAALVAQTTATGVVKIAETDTPLPGVTVTLLQQNISTKTNANGEFRLIYLKEGSEEISFSRSGYLPQIKTVSLQEGKENDLGTVFLKVDIQDEARQESILQLSESDFSEDEGKSTQNISTGLSKGDVYLSQTSFSFSPMRFRLRGYEQEFESTYINGVAFNSLDRGGFNYSSLGGLNDAMKNKDVTVGLEANSYSYGNLGSNTNIVNRASAFAAGTKISGSYSNRAYKLRGQITHATGILPSGWSFTLSGLFRWADEGIQQGTFYNSAGYFLAAEKVFNPKHSLSLVTYGAPTQRAQSSAATQEVYDLTGSIYYNSYWGYQDGKKRNSRVVKSFDPTTILTHDFKISETQRLRTGLAYHYSWYSSSALGFYNAPDPRPDYYRLLPSAQENEDMAATITTRWKFIDGEPAVPSVSQLNWDAYYLANYKGNIEDPNGSAKYMVERRHSNLMETVLNSTYTNQLSPVLKLTAGVEAKYAKDMNFKTVDDLLGANQWIDIDQFAERDFPNNSDVIQNDLNNPNRVVKKGDMFGYHYDINILHSSAFIQNEWNLSQLDLYCAGQVTYTQFNRYGYMKNGRAPENSYGTGKTWWFVDPSVKAGATYKINGRNRISVNAIAETLAPIPSGSYVSERIKDTRVPSLDSRKVLSYDLNYSATYSVVRGRVSLFQTHILGGTESTGYYDDEQRTFVNFMLSDVNKRYRGVEAGVTVKLNRSFSISAAGTYADYRYTNNSLGTMSFENGAKADMTDSVYTKDLKINTGPQTAFNITLDYFHPKMWFADITLNYFDNNYLDFAPSRFSAASKLDYANAKAEIQQKFTLNQISEIQKDKLLSQVDALGTQEKLKGGFVLDASIGKLFYLKNKRSLNFNLSLSNILNNTKMITGGFQQGRIPIRVDERTKGAVAQEYVIDVDALNKFPNKYYYAWGFNLFFNVGYKF